MGKIQVRMQLLKGGDKVEVGGGLNESYSRGYYEWLEKTEERWKNKQVFGCIFLWRGAHKDMRSERFSRRYSECFYDNGTEPLARALFPARVPRLVSSHPSCFSSMLSPAPSCTSLFYSLYSTRFCLKLPSEFFYCLHQLKYEVAKGSNFVILITTISPAPRKIPVM